MLMNKAQCVLSCCIGGMSCAFALGVWLPESRNLAGYQERILAAQEELSPRGLQPTVMNQKLTEVERLRDKLDSSERYIPRDAELASVLRGLTEAVEAEGVTEQDFQTDEPRRYKHYSVLPVELEFEDTFNASYGVLERVETMPRLVRVESLNLRVMDRESSKSGAPRMQASLRLSGFYTGPQETQP